MSSYRLFHTALILAALTLPAGACSKRTPEPPRASNDAASASAPAPVPAHAVPDPPAASTTGTEPSASQDVATAPVPTATGTITETMDAGGYTYVQLKTKDGALWAATSPIKVKVGQVLTVPLEMPMQNFHSGALKRDFPVIYFASRVAHGDAPLPARAAGGATSQAGDPAHAGGQTPPSGQMPPGHPPIGSGKAAITVTEVIPPPAGGTSIADLWAKRTSLAGKSVVVRGKVVKFLAGIMGRNWIHLQDGTGSATDGTNDVTVTTDAEAKPGDVITATGTLAIDKDFGAGYKYGAILEGATLAR